LNKFQHKCLVCCWLAS